MSLEIDRRVQEKPAPKAGLDRKAPKASRRRSEDRGSGAGAQARGGELLDLAVRESLAARGADRVEYVADPHVVETRAMTRIVYLHQHVHGVPVFRSVRLVRFDPSGKVIDVAGDPVGYRPEEVDPLPVLGAADAVLVAARHLVAPADDHGAGVAGLKVSNRRPRVLGSFPLPSSPTLVHKVPFASPILARLVLFPEGDRLHLAWYLPLRLPRLVEQFHVIVGANGTEAGEILLCQSGMAQSVLARATFFNPDLSPPELQQVPQPPAAFPAFEPRTVPGPWVTGTTTAGRSVQASFGATKKKASAVKVGGDLRFDPAEVSNDAAVVNAFFLCNYLHDFFYLLGFDESAGALQRETPPGRSDELDLLIRTSVDGGAITETQSDGERVRLYMGEIVSPVDGARRHTALDAEVVAHEYTHAVTARRVGGKGFWRPLGQGLAQAKAMDEGTSDYFALTLQNYLRRQRGIPPSLVFGAWSSGNPVTGLRPRSYGGFNWPFSSLSNLDPDASHEAGMVWCAALLAVSREIATVLASEDRGDLAGWLLVFDALPGIPVGPGRPTFLDGRDALIATAQEWVGRIPFVANGPLCTPGEAAGIEPAVRRAFAGLGMGRGASSPSGGFQNLQNDFNS